MHTEKSPPPKKIKCSDFVAQRHIFSNAQQGSDISGTPLQGVGISSKPKETKHRVEGEDFPSIRPSPMLETLKDAISFDLSTQKTSKSELDPMVKKQQSSRPTLSGAVREKNKKAMADQSGTVGFAQRSMQSHSSKWVLKDPDLDNNTPTKQHSKKPRDTMVPSSYWWAVISFKVAILLDQPEDKMSEEHQGLVLNTLQTGEALIKYPSSQTFLGI
jgi:hypothetical protein